MKPYGVSIRKEFYLNFSSLTLSPLLYIDVRRERVRVDIFLEKNCLDMENVAKMANRICNKNEDSPSWMRKFIFRR